MNTYSLSLYIYICMLINDVEVPEQAMPGKAVVDGLSCLALRNVTGNPYSDASTTPSPKSSSLLDNNKKLKFYSLLGLSTLTNVKWYPTMTKK